MAFAAFKASKVLLTVGTMLVSMWVYSLFWGWRFAGGFVLLILIHEMGHYIAARQKGLNVGAPTFIPFVGAWIQLKETPMNVETESYVAFAGPIAGTLGALACYFAGGYFGNDLLLALAYAGFIINLLNLIPVSPLDGGQITAILSPRIWLLGAPLLLVLFYYQRSPLLILIAIIAAPQLMRAFRYDPKAPENSAYYGTALQTKLAYGALYLGLAASLAVLSYDTHNMIGVR
ncbi:MAG: site-2 protease family protein [Rhizomicrobium sp.]